MMGDPRYPIFMPNPVEPADEETPAPKALYPIQEYHQFYINAGGKTIAKIEVNFCDGKTLLSGLYVAPEYRRQGYAKALIEHAISAYGDRDLWLTVWSDDASAADNNDLRAFYQTYGFVDVPNSFNHMHRSVESGEEIVTMRRERADTFLRSFARDAIEASKVAIPTYQAPVYVTYITGSTETQINVAPSMHENKYLDEIMDVLNDRDTKPKTLETTNVHDLVNSVITIHFSNRPRGRILTVRIPFYIYERILKLYPADVVSMINSMGKSKGETK